MKGEQSKAKEIILPGDPRAAELVTVRAWRSRNGTLYAYDETWTESEIQYAERMARDSGATHRYCASCGVVVAKPAMYCAECERARDVERHAKRERAAWDGKSGLYSQAASRWFWSADELLEWVEDEGVGDVEALRVVLGEPIRPALSTEHFADEFPDDGDCPDELWDAVEAFNERVKNLVLSWTQTEVALDWAATFPKERGRDE